MFNLTIRRTDSGDIVARTARAAYLMKAEGGCFGFVTAEFADAAGVR